MAITLSPHNKTMVSQNKNVRQLVWHLKYVDSGVEGSEFYCYNTEGGINSIVSQASAEWIWLI